MTKVSELKDNELVDLYIQLRDRRSQRKAAYENDDASDKSKQEKIEVALLKRFNERGLEAISTDRGTAYKALKQTCSVADWDTFFLGYVVPNQAWELITHAASKDSVRQFIAANDGALPPGLNWREEVAVNIRRSA